MKKLAGLLAIGAVLLSATVVLARSPKAPADYNGLNKGKSDVNHLYLYEKVIGPQLGISEDGINWSYGNPSELDIAVEGDSATGYTVDRNFGVPVYIEHENFVSSEKGDVTCSHFEKMEVSLWVGSSFVFWADLMTIGLCDDVGDGTVKFSIGPVFRETGHEDISKIEVTFGETHWDTYTLKSQLLVDGV